MLKSGSVYMIDEIEDSLHFDILSYFLQQFFVNDHKTQLIFTTHNQMLLDEDYMRRDMVWFTEKSKTTSSSELFSAADFKLHKNASICNAYKIGKLGMKQYIKNSSFSPINMKIKDLYRFAPTNT